MALLCILVVAMPLGSAHPGQADSEAGLGQIFIVDASQQPDDAEVFEVRFNYLRPETPPLRDFRQGDLLSVTIAAGPEGGKATIESGFIKIKTYDLGPDETVNEILRMPQDAPVGLNVTLDEGTVITAVFDHVLGEVKFIPQAEGQHGRGLDRTHLLFTIPDVPGERIALSGLEPYPLEANLVQGQRLERIALDWDAKGEFWVGPVIGEDLQPGDILSVRSAATIQERYPAAAAVVALDTEPLPEPEGAPAPFAILILGLAALAWTRRR